MTPNRPGKLRTILLWTLVLGGIGFACGFFGPIALSPEANQGPLLGIFITGPGGAAFGAFAGLVIALLGLPSTASRALLATCGVVVAGVTLFFSLPEPQHRASIVDAEILGCDKPIALAEEAIESWEDAVAKVTWAEPRAGWKASAVKMLQRDEGVVLKVQVHRRSQVYENRKPWNRGELVARPWTEGPDETSFYASWRGGSCASYPVRKRELYRAGGETSREWPPELTPNFLHLQTLVDLPADYQALLDRS